MATTVTVKGQVTIPKAVREAAGIRPGDRVKMSARPAGGVIVERETGPAASDEIEAARAAIEAAVARLHRRGIRPRLSGDQLMRLTRSDD